MISGTPLTPGRRLSSLLCRGVVVLSVAVGASLSSALPWAAGAAMAQPARDAGAEQFVSAQGQRVLAILNDHSRSREDEKQAFRAIIDQIADVPRITSFVLGKYGRTITPAQRQQFASVFRLYAQDVYESRLGSYHGEHLKVTGSVVRKPGDVIVNTVVFGGHLETPTPVAWRLAGSGGSWKVVDVQARGVWLAITQQQDFVSTIDNAGGNIDILISQLKSKVETEKAPTKE